MNFLLKFISQWVHLFFFKLIILHLEGPKRSSLTCVFVHKEKRPREGFSELPRAPGWLAAETGLL